MSGRIVALHLAPESGAVMEAVTSLIVEAGKGVVGDRYYGSRHRHLSVIAIEDVTAAETEWGSPIPLASTRRNVTTEGVVVPTEPGARLMIGSVLLEVVRRAAPCRVLDDSIGLGAKAAMRGRGGTIFRVLGDGVVNVGCSAGA